MIFISHYNSISVQNDPKNTIYMIWCSLLLCRRGMVHTTAMETRNGSHYCYGDKEWFTLLLWRRGMVLTTAMETSNGFTYCYGDKEWFTLLLWRQGIFFTTATQINPKNTIYMNFIFIIIP